MLFVLYLFNFIMASVESTKFTVCKSITSVEFDQNKANNECSESSLFFKESTSVDGNQQQFNMEDNKKLMEQAQETNNCRHQFQNMELALSVLRTQFQAFKACSSNPCMNGKCSYSNNTYLCSCNPGYTGRNCQIDINECQPDPCVNGSCTDQINGYNCSCNPGYFGKNCSTDWFDPGNGFQYKNVDGSTKPTDAMKKCEDRGARLASAGIRDESTQKIIFDELKLMDSDRVWIGLKKINDTWWWSDGIQLNMSDPRLLGFKAPADAYIYSSIANVGILPVADVHSLNYFSICEKHVV